MGAPTGCTTAIANCDQHKCTGGVLTCALCKSGKGHSAANLCAGTIMAGCDVTYWDTAMKCYFPKSGFAVVFAETTTTAFTTDKNCKSLQNGSTTVCRNCWDAYYWNTTKCKLASQILAMGAIAIASFLFN